MRDYSIDTPYQDYNEIVGAIKANRINLSFQRSMANKIACAYNKWCNYSNFIVPIISVLAMLIVCQVFSITKWLLLFGIVVLCFNTIVVYLKGILWAVAIILIALPLLFLHNSMWMLAIGAGIIGMMIGYEIWWGIITASATKELLSNEELFDAAWEDNGIALKDKSGKLYSWGLGQMKNRS